MNDVLNPDQIAALFEAAKSGNVPETSSTTAAPRRGQRVRPVDFSRPTKFTAEHQRRLLRTVDTFCLGAANRLSAELRTPVEFETLNSSQVTWMAAQSMAPTRSLAATLLAEPIQRRFLMTVEQDFVLSAIECLLGGNTSHPPKPRRFSEIDWTLSRRLLDSMVMNLSASFHDLGGLDFTIEDLDLQSDASAIASVSEPTFVIVVEARVNGLSSTVTLFIPWSGIDPVSDRISGRSLLEQTELGGGRIDRALQVVPVTLRAEVAGTELPIEEILDLRPGSVVQLGGHAASGVSLYVEQVKLADAEPGAHGARRAVQIISRTGETFG